MYFERFQLFYGVDFHLLYSYSLEKFEDTVRGFGGESTVNYFQFGPVGFVGLKYSLNSRISFSIESGYEVFYENYKFRGNTGGTTSANYRSGISASFSPMYIFNLNYHF